MLQGDFFHISSIITTDHSALATLNINTSHAIFGGHFPGHPVVPGVCMMQMVKELLESLIQKETRLRKADYMKFLGIIDPVENAIIQAELSYSYNEAGEIIVLARLFSDTTTFLKFKGLFLT